MARSYATRSNASKKKRYESKVPAWVWVFTGAVAGAFIMFLIHLADVDTSAKNKKTEVASSKPSKSTREENSIQKPRFDFYELLKETKVSIPEDVETRARSTKPKTNENENVEFILQVASFKQARDAETLRAELILLNLDARVEKAVIRNGETWHRVLVGPFDSRSNLAKARSTLISNAYEALLLKREARGAG